MNPIQKIIKGDNYRKTRFHDEKGNIPSLRRIFINGSKAYCTGLIRVIFNKRPETPWISYDATKVIKKHLNRNSRVLEFGSGMSTIWYAQNAGSVVSIENYKPWYDKINKLIKESNFANIKYIFSETREEYIMPRSHAEGLFDLIMVDGDYRSDCILNSIDLLAAGGMLYLDNSDKHSGGDGGDTRIAEEIILSYVKKNKAAIRHFTDFAPTQFTPNQGLMLTVGV